MWLRQLWIEEKKHCLPGCCLEVISPEQEGRTSARWDHCAQGHSSQAFLELMSEAWDKQAAEPRKQARGYSIFIFWGGWLKQPQKSSRQGQQIWTSDVDLSGWKHSCGEQYLLQTSSMQVGLLVQLGQQTAMKNLRKIFLTCYSKSITSVTHPHLLVPQVLQVDCFDPHQSAGFCPPPSSPADKLVCGSQQSRVLPEADHSTCFINSNSWHLLPFPTCMSGWVL